MDDVTVHSSGRRLLSFEEEKGWGVTVPSTYHAIQLVQGAAQFGQLQAGMVMRYVYQPMSFNYDITFELSRRSGGDPNLYVATSAFATLPYPHSAQWVSNFTGNDYVTVDRMDNRKCAALGCFYHIAVFIDGLQPYTGFTVTVSEGEAHTDLQSGQTYSNRLVANEPDYLRFIATQPGQTLTITLTDTGRSQPSMYVDRRTRYPNATYNQQALTVGSNGNLETGILTLNTNGPNTCNPTRTTPCTYWIQVISRNATTYSIVANAGGAIELRNAQYQEGRVTNGQYAYYKFIVSPGFTRFAVSMLLISGTANMYVTNTENFPLATANTSYVVFRDSNNLASPITIYENNPALTCSFTNRTFCTFTIAVYGTTAGNNGATQFALLATEGLRASVGVSNGLPIRQVMPTNQTYYWWAKVEANTRVQMCVTVVAGTVSGYLTDRTDVVYPDASNFLLRLLLSVPGYTCVYDYDAPAGELYWSLTNASPRDVAQISVMFLMQSGLNDTGSAIQLSDGYPQAAYLSGQVSVIRNEQLFTYPANPLIYFNFLLASNAQSLVVDLYSITGDADVYMTFLPNQGNAQLRYPSRAFSNYASNLTGSDVIVVNNAQAGRYIIGVFHTSLSPLQPTILMVTASTPNVPQTVQEGLGVRGYVASNQYKYYVLPVTGRTGVTLTLTPTRGNPDLYASTSMPPFNSTTARWRANAPSGLDIITISASDPLRPNATGSWNLYIAVNAPGAIADFTMVASYSTSATALTSGVPQPGVVASGSYNYYTYRPTNISQTIDFTIARLDGSPWLLVSPWTTEPTTTRTNISVTLPNTNLFFSLNTANAYSCRARGITLLEQCVYYIGVTNNPATSTSASLSYVLTVDQRGDVTQLVARQPIIGSVAPRATHQYMFLNTPANPLTTVVFAVTASSGDVDIYVSTTPEAGPSNYLRASTLGGDDVIVITGATATTYYIGVVNKLNSTSQYTVLGRSYIPGQVGVGAVTLSADQSYNDFCGRNDYSYYYFFVDGAWPSLTISVNARLGDPDIFVNSVALDGFNVWPNRTHYRWISDDYLSDTLTIYNPPSGQMLISLYAAVVMDAFYTISITGAGRSQVMYPGVTYTGNLEPGKAQYYQLTVAAPLSIQQLIFSLSSRVGDVDMYISDTFPQPSAARYNWSSVEVASVLDIVSLTNVTNLMTGRQNLHPGTYFVAVEAYSFSGNASYSLYASSGLRVTLADGRPTQSFLYSGGSVIFDAVYPPGQSFTVQAVALANAGNIPLYIYVSLSEGIVPGRATTYQWSTTTNSSLQELAVSGIACPASSTSCRYTILVYSPAVAGIASYVSFSISTQTPNTITTLVAGSPVTNTVAASSHHYYTFSLACPSNVSIFLTALTGNPDLYVNMGPLPPGATQGSYIWASNSVGLANDFVTIDPNVAYFRNNASRSMVGRYYVSVFSVALTSTYTLVLSVDSNCGGGGGGGGDGGGGSDGGSNTTVTYIRLTNGQPQYSRVALQRWLYYSFIVTPQQWPTGVTFALSPTDGSDPDMYITKDGTMPTLERFSWASESSAGFDDVVYISPNSTSPSPCIPSQTTCMYYVGVYGWTASSYTLTASTSGVVLGLQMDYSKDGAVAQGGWQVYSINVQDATEPLVVIASPTSGNPDLFVEFGARPTLQSLTSRTFGVDVITIPQPTSGLYYVGLYGTGPGASTYSVVASQRGIGLRNGRPQDDVLAQSGYRYYFFEFNEVARGSRPFRVQIDAISFNPALEVYVRRGNQAPTPQNAMFNLSSARGDQLSLTVPANNPQWMATATWRILVISRSATAAYSITASQGYPPIFLSDGRATDIGESVAEGEYRYFRMFVLSNLYPVTVTVSMQVGQASLYVSTSEPLPGDDTASMWNASTTAGAGSSMTVTIPRLSFPGYVYAGVRADYGSARYSVLFSTGIVLIQAGVQSPASCVQGRSTNAFVVYLPFNASFTDDVTMRVTGPANYTRPLAIFVTTNATLSRATEANSDWAFPLLDWSNPFTISRNDAKLQDCVARGNCELRITVGCQGPFTQVVPYQFSVQIGASYIPLMAGASIAGPALAAEQDRYYTITAGGMNGTGQPELFQVRVEPCVGNVKLFVNYARGGIPTEGNNDLSSTNTRDAQVVTITSPIPTGRVIATVRGVTSMPSIYQLMTFTNQPFEYFAPTTASTSIYVTNPMTVADSTIRLNYPSARIPQAVTDGFVRAPTGATGTMRYTVYWQYEPTEAVMFTQCGLNRTNIAATSFSTANTNTNMTATFRVPSDVRRYAINVLAQYVWRTGSGRTQVDTPATPGYLVYRYLTGVLPGQASVVSPTADPYPDESSSSSSGKWYPPHPNDAASSTSTPTIDKVVLAMCIGVPITVAICAVLLFLHIKNQRMAQGGGLELSERFDSAASSSAASSRGPVDKFNRLVEDNADTGAYVPPGSEGGYAPPGAQFARGGLVQHEDTNGGHMGGGGDYGGVSGQQMGNGHEGGGWAGSAQSHYAQQATQEHEQISGRGFYEL